jgi:hypothetical protein
MKTKNPKTSKPAQAACTAATPIGISPEEGDKLRRCADKCGLSVEAIARGIILDGLEKLDAFDPAAMPCPFCMKTDELEIVTWSHERRNGTEYLGDAMRCHRCESVVTLAAWMMRGLRRNPC